jgi:hypothetical protein
LYLVEGGAIIPFDNEIALEKLFHRIRAWVGW